MTRIWKYNNLLLNEKKDHIIRKLQLLSDSEKEEVIRLFDDNPQFENQIDWNKKDSLTFEDFEFLFKKEKDTQARVELLGKGVRNLKEGEDYVFLGSGTYRGESWIAVQPLTYYASRVLASKDVGPEIDARWCIATQNTRDYWDRHCFFSKEVMIFLMGESIPTKKVCITPNYEKLSNDVDGQKYRYLYDDYPYNIWSVYDDPSKVKPGRLPKKSINLIKYGVENFPLVEKYHDSDVKKTLEIQRKEAKKKFYSKLTYNPITKKYDSNGDLYIDIDTCPYGSGIVEDDEIQIPLGVIHGCFYCEGLNISSTKNFPTKVEGYCDLRRLNITTLEGLPQYIEGDLLLYELPHLESLEGFPKVVSGIDLDILPRITSLKGLPTVINGDLAIDRCRDLESLDGFPKEVKGDLFFNWRHFEKLNLSPAEIASIVKPRVNGDVVFN